MWHHLWLHWLGQLPSNREELGSNPGGGKRKLFQVPCATSLSVSLSALMSRGALWFVIFAHVSEEQAVYLLVPDDHQHAILMTNIPSEYQRIESEEHLGTAQTSTVI